MTTTSLRKLGVLASALTVGCPSSTTPLNPPADVLDAALSEVSTGVDTAPPEDTAAPEDTGPLMPSGVGEACTSTGSPFPPQRGSCGTGQLCLRAELGFSGGYCSLACVSRCPADASCQPFGQGFSVCLHRCANNSDCRRSEGYVCTRAAGTERVCRPNDEPVGQRDDGAACFTTTLGEHRLAPLPRVAFRGANLVGSARRDSIYEAEGNVVIHPVTGAVTNSYIASDGRTVFMGVSRSTGGEFTRDGRVNDPLGSASDPVLDWGSDGVLRMTYVGLARTSTGGVSQSHVRYTESRDSGMSWSLPAQVDPAGVCPAGTVCDKPWLLSGPNPLPGMPEMMYIGYLEGLRTMGPVLVIQRSADAGRSWLEPVRVGAAAVITGSLVGPNLIQMSINARGVLGASWMGLSGAGEDGSAARLGSSANRVLFRRSLDGGRTFESLRVVSRLADSPVYEQPPVVLDGENIHVAFVSGPPTGAWELILATSGDGGGTWRYRTVNDEGETCATHAFPAMALDTVTHALHLVWLENRFGEGALAYAQCPADPSMPCGANESVTDAGFRLTTGRNPAVWHGDYLGLAISAAGDMVATWSDTRAAGPHMFVARGRSRP